MTIEELHNLIGDIIKKNPASKYLEITMEDGEWEDAPISKVGKIDKKIKKQPIWYRIES